MNAWFAANSTLLLCIAACALACQLPKVLPVTFLHGDSLPAWLRDWLSFVPVAVMAALVGPDICMTDGELNISTGNLFLVVSLPTLLVAWLRKNFFLTIAVGIGLVMAARASGLY